MLKKGTYKTRKGYTAVVDDICEGADYPLRGYIVIEDPDEPEPVTIPSITWTSGGSYHNIHTRDEFDLVNLLEPADTELEQALSILRELYDFAEYPALGNRYRERAEQAFGKAGVLLAKHGK